MGGRVVERDEQGVYARVLLEAYEWAQAAGDLSGQARGSLPTFRVLLRLRSAEAYPDAGDSYH